MILNAFGQLLEIEIEIDALTKEKSLPNLSLFPEKKESL